MIVVLEDRSGWISNLICTFLYTAKTNLPHMSTVTLTKTEEILNHHLSAFMETDVNEIMKGYSENSELLTPRGPLKGLDAIRSFFEEVFKILPKGCTLGLTQTIIRDNLAYVVWSAESSFVSIPLGADTFIMENDKILYQNLAAHIIPKQ